MSRSPTKQNEENPDYGKYWARLMERVRAGESWSGNERNLCLMNSRANKQFIDVSTISGLDHADDGRAIGICDWDRDGDLDLWYRNRTAPRLRLLRNELSSRKRSFVAIRLQGTTSARDAIGARVEVIADATPKGQRLVRSLHAGDLFLSQSSKWLHFGLSRDAKIEDVIVHWPGGERESFSGVKNGGRHLLVQGSGSSKSATSPPVPGLAVAAPLSKKPTTNARIILPRRIPFPRLAYRELSENARRPKDPMARALVVWSQRCEHCREDLATFAAKVDELQSAAIDVLALSIDEALSSEAARDSARRVISDTKFPFPWGVLDGASLERVTKLQEVLFDRPPPSSVPITFLTDSDSRLLAIYRGRVSPSELVEDAKRLRTVPESELHSLAPPIAGSWFTRPVDDLALFRFLADEFATHSIEDSVPYLTRAFEAAK
ncbi:MAG: ASPIC/UnbV domain-containing protein, partial [Planctomycetota bacterium]